ncbi:hypothetical protein B0H13DRAFT_1868370 [Mycena leptocephala]|nr:hypothetical protein B0H13DRAFT_1868370 [Mycena leptocephala]
MAGKIGFPTNIRPKKLPAEKKFSESVGKFQMSRQKPGFCEQAFSPNYPGIRMVAATILVLPLFFGARFVNAGLGPSVIVPPQVTNADCAKSKECTAFNTDVDACDNTYVQNAAACFTCQAEAGGFTAQSAQQHLDGVVEACGLQGKPVNPVTLSLSSLAPTGTTLSNTAVNPFTSTPADSNPSSSLGSQASSASSPPPSSSVGPGKTGSAMSVKGGSSGFVAAVLVALTFVATLV